MSDFNGRKVTYAKLHTEAFIPGGGSTTSTLSTGAGAKTNDLQMTKVADGLHVIFKGHEILIPLGNIIHMVLEKLPVVKK